jgi:hypothetical protein
LISVIFEEFRRILNLLKLEIRILVRLDRIVHVYIFRIMLDQSPGLVFTKSYLKHRHLSNIDCLSFVMCPLLAPVFHGFFLLQPLTVLTKQTRQVVCAIKQSILLRCLWSELTIFILATFQPFQASTRT